jgi:hypothetical protein
VISKAVYRRGESCIRDAGNNNIRAITRIAPTRTLQVELKTKIWMTGSLDWFGYIGDEEMFLGHRSFPNPPEEGDAWTNEVGDMFKIIDGVITLTGKTEPPKKYW